MRIDKIACIGAGVIGASWAVNFLIKGFEVNVQDIGEDELKQAENFIEKNLDYLVEKEVLSKEDSEEAIGLVSFTTRIEEAVSEVQLIQENAPEKYELKKEILKEIDHCADEKAIFASSTSGLLISKIAEDSKYPERCLGAHPYNPPHLIPLVEITKGNKTKEEVVETAYEFYKGINKEPIILQKEVLGFIANRLALALYREAVNLIDQEICTVEDIDKAVCYGPGLRYAIMGPNLLYHLGGGSHGIKGILQHIGPSVEKWWEDMATFTKIPEEFAEKAQEGVEKELTNRPQEFGNTPEEVARFRDNMLIEILKMHKKL